MGSDCTSMLAHRAGQIAQYDGADAGLGGAAGGGGDAHSTTAAYCRSGISLTASRKLSRTREKKVPLEPSDAAIAVSSALESSLHNSAWTVALPSCTRARPSSTPSLYSSSFSLAISLRATELTPKLFSATWRRLP